MTDLPELERRLWAAADELRANSNLSAAQYRDPVLGLIFLAFAEQRFEDNPELAGVLPQVYARLNKSTLIELIRLLAPLSRTVEGDAFGLIYEYFLSAFAMEEGRGGGESFTPSSIVSLMVEVIEPYHGRIFDPACGSGGMFVQSAKFVNRHKRDAAAELSVYGCELKEITVPLAKMNLALYGLGGDIIEANSYYEDPHAAHGKFDFVLANPPSTRPSRTAPAATRSCSSTPATPSVRSTARTATSRPSRSSGWRTSSAFGAANRLSTLRTVPRDPFQPCSRTSAMPTCPVCARRQRWRRSKPKAGA